MGLGPRKEWNSRDKLEKGSLLMSWFGECLIIAFGAFIIIGGLVKVAFRLDVGLWNIVFIAFLITFSINGWRLYKTINKSKLRTEIDKAG